MALSKQEAEVFALKSIASIASREFKRDLISPGSKHEIDLRISGTVDGQKVSRRLSGSLQAGTDNPTGTSSKPKLDEVAAMLLDRLSDDEVSAIMKKRSLGKPKKKALKLAQALIARFTVKSMRRGSISFVELASEKKAR